MSAHAFVVRRLTSQDSAIAAQAVADIKHGFGHEVVEREAVRLRIWLARRDHVFLAALEDSRPIGFALGYLLDRIDGTAPMLMFYEIEVMPEHRRRGVGMRLVEAMKAIARAERVAKLWVQTAPENIAAQALYERAGGRRGPSADEIYRWTAAALNSPERP